MLVGKGKMHAKVNYPQKKIITYCFYFQKNLQPTHR